MREWFRKIRRIFFEYRPLVRVLIYRDNLLQNWQEVSSRVPKWEVWPVLKSNAYGHGLVEVAKIFDKKVQYLVVDSYYEAVILRNEGVKSKILIVGYTHWDNVLNNKLKDVSFVITDIKWLEIVEKQLKKETLFHLKIDTGMNRQGVEINELDEVIEIARNNRNIVLEGVCSHLADADNREEDFTKMQIRNWNKVVEKFENSDLDIKYFHLSATEGVRYCRKINANAMRLGLGLYGFSENKELNRSLKPALGMRSIISTLRKVMTEEKVGYATTYKAGSERLIATVPVGYFEGVDRRLSNIGKFRVLNHDCEIVGRVSMNITSIDVTDSEIVKIGDEVEVIGVDKSRENTVDKFAKMCDCIPYEILVHIPSVLRREIV